MFSRDPKHNRPTPRTVQQAFGPYHHLPSEKRDVHGVVTVIGTVLLGVAFGLLMAWRG